MMAAHLLRRSWGGTISLLIVILLLSCCSQMTSAAAAPASRKSGGGGGGSSSGTSMSQQNKLDVRQHLKRLNKPPLKTIKSPDGDIIDCVHIAHQPAFDHPLLKNHTIQTRPNFHPDGTKFEESKRVSGQKARSSKPITQLWHLKGRCPEGTIPIRRTKKDDILRAKSIERFGQEEAHQFSSSTQVCTT
ncbi:hypothetical protein OIU77_017149 [Salix suchowensis]|uniref:Neprosin activation peptide domain-containing protein n=1 Tax=Salix suchowensis TaxID=1278906 RepID=A0ABQ8ZMS7_9ROSI|nr:hypothetical protein OIU77_017149 [Salix suchowensis]